MHFARFFINEVLDLKYLVDRWQFQKIYQTSSNGIDMYTFKQLKQKKYRN